MKVNPETMPHCFVVNTSSKVLMISQCGRVSYSACECVSKVKVKASPATIMVIIFSDFLMFDQIFLSLTVKQSVIISNKHGIYKLPHEFPNDLKSRILGN